MEANNNKEIVQNTEKQLSYETLKDLKVKEFEATEKKEIVDYINQNIKAVKSVRKFLAADYSGELTDEYIIDNLQDDAKHLIDDIADSKEKCYLGLYKLNDIEHDLKLCKNEFFWNWADTVTGVKPYSLQNTQLDLIILKGLDEIKDKDESKYFDQIIRITKQNASSKSLEVFVKLIHKLVLDYKENAAKINKGMIGPIGKKSDVKFQRLKDAASQEIIRKINSVIEALNDIIVKHQQSHSYRFYLEMNPEYIEQICKDCKTIEDEDEQIKWRESLLRNLITYYVSFAREYSSIADIENLCANWKLDKIFSIVYEYSNDADLQEKILDSFSTENAYLPYLPMKIIESTFNQEDEEKQRKIIYYLENRYKISNEKERKTIINLNNEIILNSKKSIKIREEAFNWIYKELKNKDDWSQRILADLLKQCKDKLIDSSIQTTLSFTQIIKKCYESIKNKDTVKSCVADYVVSGINKELTKFFTSGDTPIAADNLNEIITEMIANAADEKTPDICNYLYDAIQKSVLRTSVWQKALSYLSKIYKTSSFKDEISVCLKKCIRDEKVSDEKRKEIFEKFIPQLADIYAENPLQENGKIICDFIAEIKDETSRKSIFSSLFSKFAATASVKKQFLSEFIQTLFTSAGTTDAEKIKLLSEYFDSGIDNNISDVQLGELKKYINYIWSLKDKFISETNSILDIISKSSNANLIRYTISKGWSN